jgi:DNA-binding SARP family transcriptional activator
LLDGSSLPAAATEPLSKRYRQRLPLEFRILGPLEVARDGRPVPLGGPKQRATLAILLLNANRVVSIEKLADDLYAGSAPVTAVTQVQRQVSELRKALGSADAIETRSPGYVLRVGPDELDLHRFEQLASDGRSALSAGDARTAAEQVAEALALSRGDPLSDLAYDSFAQVAIARLEELVLAARELYVDARILLGEHTEALTDLQELTADHPLRERLRERQMLALYRSGRQAEALEVYRQTRTALAAELGLEPTPALQALERAILAQDPALATTSDSRATRAVLVLPGRDETLDSLLRIGGPLTSGGERELLVAKLLLDGESVETASRSLNATRDRFPASTRVAAFTSTDRVEDAIRLVQRYDVDLLLADAPQGFEDTLVPSDAAAILERSAADVAFVCGTVTSEPLRIVAVPFSGGDHDWAALHLGAWLATATGASLRLVGTKTDPSHGGRDASRLLADASIAVQRVVGITSEPSLAEPTAAGLLEAVDDASLVAVGISTRWRVDGVGSIRRALIRDGRPPVLVVHRGTRPSGLAPPEARSRFTWSIES